MMMRRKLKEQMYDDDKPKIIKTEDYSKGSGFVELSGKTSQELRMLSRSLSVY